MDAVRAPLLVAALLALTAARHPTPPPAPAPVVVPVSPSIKAGVEKWRAGDYPAAVAMWQPFANAGDPDALFNIGQAYKLGRGVPLDAATARDYYRKAALKGHLPAQANLGIALFQVGEKPEAIKWLRTAADRGEARAQYVLGIAAFNGDGLPRSQALGYGYLLRAQASGLPQAVTALGSIAPGLAPADRTAGEAVAASIAAGTGVPAALAATTAPRMIMPVPAGPLKALPTGPTLPIRTPAGSEIAVAKPAQPAVQVSAPTRYMPVPSGPAASPPARLSTPAVAPALPVPEQKSAQADGAARAAALTAATRAATTRTATPPVKPAQVDATVMAAGEGGAKPAGAPIMAAPTSVTPASGSAPSQVPSAIATVAVPASKPVTLGAPPPAALAPKSVTATPDVARKPVDPLAPKATGAVVAPLTPKATGSVVANATRLDAKPKVPAAPPPLKPFQTIVAEPGATKPSGWRVQLGAFSARKLADAAWVDIKATAAPAKPIFATDGPVTKLQMGPFATRDAAKAACAKLTAAGRACFVTQG